ncbi:thioredoxin, partial [Clostridium saudiense]|nr:thioredoxin [Clostridium saudiense]
PKIVCREVNGEKHIDLAAEYDIFSLPIMLLFIEGKEFLRLGRNVNLLELKMNIERYYNMIF